MTSRGGYNKVYNFHCLVLDRAEHQGKDEIEKVTNTCRVCDRSLLHSFKFCSLGCKIVGASKKFLKRNKHWPENTAVSDSDESSYSSRKLHSFTPLTPTPPLAKVVLSLLCKTFSTAAPPSRENNGATKWVMVGKLHKGLSLQKAKQRLKAA
ncbi:PLATZ transcription factor family protein [Perilla frutescens var. hirtella]|nr:PLATZ transcription factor family protein [Perilla frutescens var. hirtella]